MLVLLNCEYLKALENIEQCPALGLTSLQRLFRGLERRQSHNWKQKMIQVRHRKGRQERNPPIRKQNERSNPMKGSWFVLLGNHEIVSEIKIVTGHNSHALFPHSNGVCRPCKSFLKKTGNFCQQSVNRLFLGRFLGEYYAQVAGESRTYWFSRRTTCDDSQGRLQFPSSQEE